jgi:hypothetical protein
MTGTGTVVAGPAAIVTGPGSDPPATAAAADLLHASGVTEVEHVASGARITADARLVVYAGGPQENPASGPALDRLGVPGPQGLPAEGTCSPPARMDRLILIGTGGRNSNLGLAPFLCDLLAPSQLRNQPEHDRRGGCHNTGDRTDDGPGERIHAVTIRTPRVEHDQPSTSYRQPICSAERSARLCRPPDFGVSM